MVFQEAGKVSSILRHFAHKRNTLCLTLLFKLAKTKMPWITIKKTLSNSLPVPPSENSTVSHYRSYFQPNNVFPNRCIIYISSSILYKSHYHCLTHYAVENGETKHLYWSKPWSILHQISLHVNSVYMQPKHLREYWLGARGVSKNEL